jgi:hypothetical protein
LTLAESLFGGLPAVATPWKQLLGRSAVTPALATARRGGELIAGSVRETFDNFRVKEMLMQARHGDGDGR